MAAEEPKTGFEEEIAVIENRAGTRRLFMMVGGAIGVLLLAVVVLGARERVRLARESARATTAEVVLGRYIGTASNQAVFAQEGALAYLEGVGDAEIGPATRFVRTLAYDAQGNPVELTAEVRYWKLESADSLPYMIEPMDNPLIGVNPSQFREIQLGALTAADYGTGGPRDWRSLEEEGADVRVTGRASRSDGAVLLTEGSSGVRVQGVEGLSPLDSLEVAWATESGAPLTAYGTISSSPRTDVLFVLIAEAVHAPEPEGAAETPAGGAAEIPAGGAGDTALPESGP